MGDSATVSESGSFVSSTRQRVLEGQRVVVTGGSGFIGTRVLDELTQAGAWVLSVDVAAPRAELPAGAEFVRCDIRSERFADVLAEFAPQIVVHLAARVDAAESVHRPVLDADVNVRGTIAVLDAAATAGADLLVFASSCAVYGEVAARPAGEDQRLAPLAPYGMSKATAMRWIEWFAQHRGLAATSLILGNVYGPSATSRQGGVIGRFLTDAAAGRASVLHGDGRSTRDFVHVDDVTSAVLQACASESAGRVNIASGVATSVQQVHALVAAATDCTLDPVPGPAREGDIARMCLQVDRAERVLGWRPRIGVAEGIAALASGFGMEASA